MSEQKPTRREFLKTSAGVAAATTSYTLTASRARAASKNDRLNVASIGVGGRGSGIGHQAGRLGNMVACCDVDSQRADKFASKYEGKCEAFVEYEKILDRKDVDAVTIGTPDHWHTKIAIDAMKAGKDVYCEKPLTLTIDEGKLIQKVVKETGKVFQVGTQQRSEYDRRFLKAVAIAQSGRLGFPIRATASVGKALGGGPFQESEPPAHLDWDRWLGQTALTPYIKERTHYQFRWWHEYSGGQVTDWGVHHADIALWALGMQNTGPIRIEGAGEFSKQKNHYNVARVFHCTMDFANRSQIVLASGDNELILEGPNGRIRVNRGGLSGKPAEDIAESAAERDKLDEAVGKLYRGMAFNGHMQNFFDCIADRSLPISDVFTHHRSVSVCHLANISMRLERKLNWDPDKEDFKNDEEASSYLKREQRSPYEIVA